jgi:hypothetical protein
MACEKLYRIKRGRYTEGSESYSVTGKTTNYRRQQLTYDNKMDT